MIYQLVSKSFDKHVKELLKERTELLAFVLGHERRQLLITRLTKQIKKAKSKGKLCTKEAVDNVVKDFVSIFAQAAVAKADQEANKKDNEWLKQFHKEDPDLEGFNVETKTLDQ